MKLSEETRLKSCPYCKNPLHYARYHRKGRLIDVALPEDWSIFHSLCCSAEGCRKRVRPLSLRFAGQSPSCTALFLLAELIKSGGSMRSIISICHELNISERTARRWLSFWKKVYLKSTWWRKMASKWMKNGQTLHDIWTLMLKTKNNLVDSFYDLLKDSVEIWSDISLFGGDYFPAKDA